MKIVKISDIANESSHHGTVSRRALLRSRDVRSNIVSVNEAYLDPGQAFESHAHADAEEFFYIISGEGEMTLNNETIPASSDTFFLAHAGDTHSLKNTGNSVMKFVSCMVKL